MANSCQSFRQRLAVLVLGCLLAATAAAQTTVEVIPLKYRQADQIIPVIQPLLGPGASVSNCRS